MLISVKTSVDEINKLKMMSMNILKASTDGMFGFKLKLSRLFHSSDRSDSFRMK